MDKKEAVRLIRQYMMVHHIGEYPHIKLKEAMDMAIEALRKDAVEVVRCKDCKHWIAANNGSWHMIGRTDGYCKMLMNFHDSERYMTEGEHFCSYGEMRTDEN